MNGQYPSAHYRTASQAPGWEMQVASSAEHAAQLGPDWQPADVFFRIGAHAVPVSDPPAGDALDPPAAPAPPKKTRGRAKKPSPAV